MFQPGGLNGSVDFVSDLATSLRMSHLTAAETLGLIYIYFIGQQGKPYIKAFDMRLEALQHSICVCADILYIVMYYNIKYISTLQYTIYQHKHNYKNKNKKYNI